MGRMVVEASHLKGIATLVQNMACNVAWLRAEEVHGPVDETLERPAQIAIRGALPYAAAGMTVPVRLQGKPRGLPVNPTKLNAVVKGAKGPITVEWTDEATGPGSGVVKFSNGKKVRSVLLEATEEKEVRQPPVVPGHYWFEGDADELRRFAKEAETLGKSGSPVEFRVEGGKAVLRANGDAEGESLDLIVDDAKEANTPDKEGKMAPMPKGKLCAVDAKKMAEMFDVAEGKIRVQVHPAAIGIEAAGEGDGVQLKAGLATLDEYDD
jgi:hypothetical protein